MAESSSPMPFIDLKKAYLAHKEEFDEALLSAAAACQYIAGPQVTELEEKLADFVGCRHAIACSSGTSALELSLRALNIGPSDEVITVPFTWVATANSIRLVGATPVFVDIDPSTFLMDIEQVRAAITSKTKAIMPVSLFGHMADMSALDELASKHNLVVIEDAAQSFGASQNGTISCHASRIGCTSFYPSKTLGCWGEGGCVFVDDDEIARLLRAILNHGGPRDNHFVLGTNARLDTIQAAVLLVRLKYFPEELERRQALAERYTTALSNVSGVLSTPVVLDGNRHAWAQYTITLEPEKRTGVQDALRAAGIPTCVFYDKCVHLEKSFQDLSRGVGTFPVAEACSQKVLQLPFHPWMDDCEVDRVVDAVRLAMQ